MTVLYTEENYQYAFISFSFRYTHSDIYWIMNDAVNNIWTLAYWEPAIFVSLLHGLTLSWKHTFTIWPFYHTPWWRHQMETFSALLAICAGNSPVPVNSPHKGQWRGVFMFSLICARINGCVNNCEAGDLRLHRVHFDVIIMLLASSITRYCTCHFAINTSRKKPWV